MQGLVYKSTGSWYLVKDKKNSFIECKLAGKLRNSDLKSTNPVCTGDFVNIKIDKRKLANGPANIIEALCHFGFESNVFFNCSSVSWFDISGSSSINLFVIIETYPPRGIADRANSVPCLSSFL